MHDDHVVLTVRLVPNAGRERIDGVEHLADGQAVLKARVAAVPRDDAANDALTRFLARSLGLSRSAVTLVAGRTHRVKRFELAGDAEPIVQRLQTLAKGDDKGRKRG